MTQASSDSPQRRRAEFHLARAGSYLQDANLMLERYNKLYSAAALLYESAKQCINAVANLNGQNPGAVGAKRAYLRSLARQYPGNQFNLIRGWEFATRLHIHADRGHLAGDLFRDAWQVTQAFIDDMLTIYDANR
ncbi:MAG: hypothetical protein F4X34_08605 [Chloroflexi bacterium]|nr:hypothetical protein [Chloroflexota bacterium]